MDNDKYTIPEIIERAKSYFGIATKISKLEKSTTKSLNKSIRMKIVRTLENEYNKDGQPYLDKNKKAIGGKKCKHYFSAQTVNWLLNKKLYDYFINLSDCEETLARLKKQKEYEKKAEDMREEAFDKMIKESREGIPIYNEMTEAEYYGVGKTDFRLTGYDGDRIYRHMIEKIFEKFYGEFNFEKYMEDSLANDLFSLEHADATLIPSIERYNNLSIYYKEK